MCNLIVYTDGSCKKNKLNNSVIAGYGIHFPNKEFKDVSEQFTLAPITNQRAELYAIYKCLMIVDSSNNKYDIHIYSDSMYSINSFTVWIHTWLKNNFITSNNEPVKNVDIILPTYKLMLKHNISFHHVRSHTGKTDVHSLGNSIADKLATSYSYSSNL